MDRRARIRGLLMIAIGALAIAGCGDAGVPGPSVARPATIAPTSAPTMARTIAPSLTPASATTRPTVAVSAAPAGTFLYDPTVDARAEVVAAIAAAKADGKRVLIDYGADWCPDCHSLAAVLDSAAGRTLIDAKYHVVRVDVGFWDHNIDVAREYGNAIDQGIPSVVILDGRGAVIGTTADGSLANARVMTADEMLAILARWAG